MEGSLILAYVVLCITFVLPVVVWSNGENPFTHYQKEKQRKLLESQRYDFMYEMEALNRKPGGRTLKPRNKGTQYSFAKRIFIESNDWHLMRKTVFQMYGRTCMKCESTTQLEVDHIYPMYLYPDLRLSLNNLQVLCRKCNRDKGTEIADYRPNSIGETSGQESV
jgi:5-methylcytosine-specific restriction endonuclease McrA